MTSAIAEPCRPAITLWFKEYPSKAQILKNYLFIQYSWDEDIAGQFFNE